MVKLINKAKYILFVDRRKVVFKIKKEFLCETTENMDDEILTIFSIWFFRLGMMPWATKDLMLQLREIIKRECPKNKINWEETDKFINFWAYLVGK